MSKPKTTRDIQVRHRLSGAALLGMREPMAPTMAIDAAPRAGDVARLRKDLAALSKSGAVLVMPEECEIEEIVAEEET